MDCQGLEGRGNGMGVSFGGDNILKLEMMIAQHRE